MSRYNLLLNCVKRLVKTTIFCPNCGTANRDDADVCSECGSVIPRIADETPQKNNESQVPDNFNIELDNNQNSFDIAVSYPPPPPPQEETQTTDSSQYEFRQFGDKIVCERCGTVLRADDRQCSGCGKPLDQPVSSSTQQSSTPYQPHTPTAYPPPPPSPYAPKTDAYTPIAPPSPYPTTKQPTPYPRPQPKTPSQKVAKCAKCGAIVYDYESKCSNCGRILAPPKKVVQEQVAPVGRAPPGTARCGKCNAIVYPHQTACPNCGKPLAPVTAPRGAPGQRISRCRRCGHRVYPTDQICPNCNRKLDPV